MVEGPPQRACPILLRQTSFKALKEAIRFTGSASAAHTARFGEIEQRGGADAQGPRALRQVAGSGALTTRAAPRPTMTTVCSRSLRSSPTRTGIAQPGPGLLPLQPRGPGPLASDRRRCGPRRTDRPGLVLAEPITYEDFLPVRGRHPSLIWVARNRSNTRPMRRSRSSSALGVRVHDEIALTRPPSSSPWPGCARPWPESRA
ncbi:DUF1338 family protein [Staphylococcus epidermidis]|nr:DUF1338 family protein [Staphylococcus epidermidis]